MTKTSAQATNSEQDILKLAIIAVGGQGGGVLTNWVEAMARAQGWTCQATSVAGVAQRTGATIYYVEMARPGVVDPVFSLAPSAGDVDVVIAAELMEAGRAIMRGFVTSDRTTLIASTHRTLAVSEKSHPADGTADAEEVLAAANVAARRHVMFDLDGLAVRNGSVISASLFGALAGVGCLPFAREAFEAAIRSGGKGVEPSLRAFSAAYAAVDNVDLRVAAASDKPLSEAPNGPERAMATWGDLVQSVDGLPENIRGMARKGLRKVVDFQDVAYGRVYLDRVQEFAAQDVAGRDFALTEQAAKYIANAMAYDDIIKVADLKTSGQRFSRIRADVAVNGDNYLQLTEYFHPRAEEITSLLPARMGRRVSASDVWQKRLGRWFSKGRRLRTDRLLPFLMLYLIGGLKSYRLRTLRHAVEQNHIDGWLDLVRQTRKSDYDLAVEILKCRRLIKGYSDTHSRGLSKYDRVLATLADLSGRSDAAQWLQRLRTAALQDESGTEMEGAIQTVKSFTPSNDRA